MASVKSQWLKKTILQRNLPNKQKEDVKSYLTLERADAGNHIYFDMKSDSGELDTFVPAAARYAHFSFRLPPGVLTVVPAAAR